MKIYTDNSLETLVKFDTLELHFMITHMCASILHETQSEHIKKELGCYVHWADHGFMNALLFNVSFVYDIIKKWVETKNKYELYKLNVDLIKDSLNAFQNYKTADIEKNKKDTNCDYFGDATEFNKKDWTDIFNDLDEIFKGDEK